jgi:hypothetical protein
VDGGSIPPASTTLGFIKIQKSLLNPTNKPPSGGFFVPRDSIPSSDFQRYWGYI